MKADDGKDAKNCLYFTCFVTYQYNKIAANVGVKRFLCLRSGTWRQLLLVFNEITQTWDGKMLSPDSRGILFNGRRYNYSNECIQRVTH